MGRDEITISEMLNTIHSGAGKVKEALENGDSAAITAYDNDMKFVVESDDWEASRCRCNVDVQVLMDEIQDEVTDKLNGLLYNKRDTQKVLDKLSYILEIVDKCRNF